MRTFLIKLLVPQYALRLLTWVAFAPFVFSMVQRTPFAVLGPGFTALSDAVVTGLIGSILILWVSNFRVISKARRRA